MPIDPKILEAIPHRPPMLLVDRIVLSSDDEIECEKDFREDEYFFQGHYPEFALVPGVILCEAAMQAGAILLTAHLEGESGVPVATRMNQVRFRRMIRPGDTVRLKVRLKERLADAFFLDARVMLDGKTAVQFEFACTLAPGGEAPGGEAPGGEAPGGEAPGGEAPGGEAAGGEAAD